MTIAEGDVAFNLIDYSKGYITSGNTQTKAISLVFESPAQGLSVLTNYYNRSSQDFVIP